MSHRKGSAFFVLLVLICLFSTLSAAQDAPNLTIGIKPYGAYQGGDVDSVDLINGNVNVHIPLVSYPQRGGKLKLAWDLVANNKGWVPVFAYNSNGTNYYKWVWRGDGVKVVREQSYKVRDNPMRITQNGTYIGMVHQFFVDSPDGASHELASAGAYCSGMNGNQVTIPGITLDGSGFACTSAGTGSSLADRDGVTYSAPMAKDPNGNYLTLSSSSIIDTHGLTYSVASVLDSGFVAAWTPGATLTTTSGPFETVVPGTATSDYSNCPSGTVSARIWTPQTTANETFKFCFGSYAIGTSFGVQFVLEGSNTMRALNAILLPDGSSWQFSYDRWGDLTQILFPTGGSISYTWGTLSTCNSGGGTGFTSLIARRVTSRTVNDGLHANTWNYSTTTGPMTVTAPDGSASVHYNDCFYESEVDYFNPPPNNTSPVKKVQTQWSYQSDPWAFYTNSTAPINAHPTQITTILDNGKTAITKKTYDSGPSSWNGWLLTDLDGTFPLGYPGQLSLNDVLEQDDYDFGNSSTPSRKTFTNYLWQTNLGYITAGMVDLATSVQIKDGSNNLAAETDSVFDGSNSAVTSGVSVHRSTPPNGVRGNLSSVNRVNIGGSNATTTYSVYDTGLPATKTDPNGKQTTFSYSTAAGYDGAYLTATQLPNTQNSYAYPSCTGSYPHSSSALYDTIRGLVTSTTDENNQTTTYSYDNMRRPAIVTYPSGGGQINFFYPDYVTTERQRQIDSNRHSDAYIRVDGIGREIQRATLNDESTPWDQVDTCYDGRGNVSYKTYTYQGSGIGSGSLCSTPGDSYTYDGLSRVTSVTHGDGSSISTTYAGAAAKITDETGTESRISQSDALGRLTNVCEVSGNSQQGTITPNPSSCGLDVSGTGFLTMYSYNTLGDLLSATQGGLGIRTFTYDSLSRLRTATNPESGTTTYTYDNNGNVTQRQRPAPNQFNGNTLVTTNYSYDALNRLTQTSYANDSSGTPVAKNTWDCNAVSGMSNTDYASGRLGRVDTSNTSMAYAYDSLGRTWGTWQTTPIVYGSSTGNEAYTYDYIGNLVSATNYAEQFGGNPLTLSYSFNRASRLTSVTSSYSDGNHPAALLNNVHYNAFGLSLSASIGAVPITDTRTYTARGWLSSVSEVAGAVTSSTGTVTVSGGEQSRIQTNATPGLGSVTINGTEGSTQVLTQPATSGTGTVTITGTTDAKICTDWVGSTCRFWEWDSGTVSITVNGAPTFSVNYNQQSTASTVATALRDAINNGSTLVSASVNNAVITLTAKAQGAGTNYSLSASIQPGDPDNFAGGSFPPQPSGANLTGGQNAQYTTSYDTGTVTIVVNGRAESVSYGQNSTNGSIAQSLAGAFTSDGGSYVNATYSGSTVNLTSKLSGASTNYSLSASSNTTNGNFSSPSFTTSPSGSQLTGGTDATTVYDAGFVWATVNGTQSTASYGQGSTTSTVATALAQAINGNSPWVNATSSGNVVTLTSIAQGANTNYPLSASSSSSAGFNPVSFTTASSGMSGGSGGSLYNVTVNYLSNGDVQSSTDSVNGSWTYAYDEFNRLSAANRAAAYSLPAVNYTYQYDRFGNRWNQNVMLGSGLTMLLTFDANNHIPGNAPDSNPLYDAAGNLRYDQTTGNYLRYDAENRLIGVGTNVTYVYNGQGQRVEKNLSGVKTDYLYDLASHVITAFQSAGTWQRGEIYAGGWHLGTYYPNATYFSFTDWLGTEHYRTDNVGNLYQTCYNLAFGDGQTCAGTDISPLHFTGKERDTESGLDNFGARHYNSAVGRFMSADWAAKPTAVPYAEFGNPHSLNLYGYVGSNPLRNRDLDGHCDWCFDLVTRISAWIASHPAIGDAANKVGASASGTLRVGVGHAETFKAATTEASATIYAKTGGSHAESGADLKFAARVGAVGGEATINAPLVRDGSLVNPLKEGSVDISGVITGTAEKGALSGSASSGDSSFGGSYGEGLVVGAEGSASNDSLSELIRAVGDSIVTDVSDTINKIEQSVGAGTVVNPN